MKRFLQIGALLLVAFTISNSVSAQSREYDYTRPQATSFGEWMMAKEGYWLGRIDGMAWWYRLSPDGQVSRSTDARNWEEATTVVGKDNMGVVIRLTPDQVVTGEEILNAWIPNIHREWDQENGLGYENAYVPLIWSQDPPKLYRQIF